MKDDFEQLRRKEEQRRKEVEIQEKQLSQSALLVRPLWLDVANSIRTNFGAVLEKLLEPDCELQLITIKEEVLGNPFHSALSDAIENPNQDAERIGF